MITQGSYGISLLKAIIPCWLSGGIQSVFLLAHRLLPRFLLSYQSCEKVVVPSALVVPSTDNGELKVTGGVHAGFRTC